MEQISRDAVRSLHASAAVQDLLMEKGYYSSAEIMHKPKHSFMRDMEQIISREEAEKIYKKARIHYMKMTHAVLAVSDISKKHMFRSDREKDSMQRRFEKIPSYRDIFGTTDYCTCKKCRSIFGPAAYFVDLMRIAGTYLDLDDQAVSLKERRQDLWELVLSCENTNKELPYIQIVNGILERYLNRAMLYQEIAASCYPQVKPFALPLAKIRLYLARKEVSAEWMLRCWGADEEKAVIASLGISPELYELLKHPLDDQGRQKLLGGDYSLEEMSDAAFFLEKLQMDHQQLYRLLGQDIKGTETDREELRHGLFINRGLAPGTYVDITDGRIVNLEKSSLERILRFVRLSRIFGLAFEDMEWLIRITGSVDGQLALQDIAVIWRMSADAGIAMNTLFVLLGDLKDYGDDPFGQVFGTDRETLTQMTKQELLRKLSEVIPAKYEDLIILREYMGDSDVTPDAYYRHVLLADGMQMTIHDYVAVLGLLYETPVIVYTPALLKRLLEFRQEQTIVLETLLQLVTIHDQPAEALPKEYQKLPEQLRFIRESMPEACRLDEEKRKDYIYLQLSDYFQVDRSVLEDLFACSAGENAEDLPDSVLNEENLLRGMYAYLLLYRSSIPAALLKTVSFHRQIFLIEHTDRLKLHDIQSIMRFGRYGELYGDVDGLLYEFAADYAAGRGNQALLKLTGWNEDDVRALETKWFFDKEETGILDYLERITCGMHALGRLALSPAECDTVAWILVNGYDAYPRADALAGRLVDAFLTEDERAVLEADKRTAILPLAAAKLRETYEDIKDGNDLYKYFLIDVQMDDRTRISYIKEGINAVQLYLQRCRLHLENGIREISIPATWWSWIMDYTMWESNRRIFVYPENYLISSVRHSKTGLFKEVEEALEQTNITEGYIEEQYMKYLDSYYDLTQLKICGAYETTIDHRDVLYVFARTKQEPYAYYLCSRTGSLAWTEWEKIDINIDSDSIYPVYVFGRLHIFWTVVQGKEKVKLKDGSDLLADNQISYSLQIKYTYKNLQGKWIAPQTLLGEETIYVEETGEQWKQAEALSRKFHIYDTPASYRRLTLMRLTEKNLKDFQGDGKPYECLVVVTGSFAPHQGAKLDPVQGDSVLDHSQKEYLDKLNKIVEDNNFEVFNKETGYLSTGVFRIYNEEMEEVRFLHDREFVVVDAYIPTRASLICREVCDELHKAVGVYLSQHILQDGMIPSKDIMPFFNNDLQVRQPMLTRHSFVMDAESTGGITQPLSEKIYDKLVQEGIISPVDQTTGYANEKYLASADLQQYLGELLDADGADGNNQLLRIQDILLKNIGAVCLFGKAKDSEVIPVVNQPGKFICDFGDEAFLTVLVYSHDNKGKQEILPVPLTRTEEGVQVGNPVTSAEIMRLGIRKQTAQQIVDVLQEAAMISRENNIVSVVNCTRDGVEGVLKDVELPGDREAVLDRLYGCLMNFPVISMADFEGIPHISAQEVCKVLQSPENRILYLWDAGEKTYRIDLIRMQEKTDIVFRNDSSGVLDDESVARIYRVMAGKASSIHFNYRINDVLPREFRREDFKDWKFEVQRMTNPTIKKLRRKLETGGIDTFLNRKTQSPPADPVMPFSRFEPSPNVIPPRAEDGVQIDFEGLYGEYNWELFFHIPMMLAEKFRASSLFEEGVKWLNYVFDPTKQPDGKIERYYWNFYPFVTMEEETMEQLLRSEKTIAAYNDSPFDPHAIARLRVGAYGKCTVMAYVTHLIAWGDRYFVKNTWESLTTATMLYVWAGNLLGSRPEAVKEKESKEDKSFRQIEEYYAEIEGGIPQFLVDLEAMIAEDGTRSEMIVPNDEIPYNDVRAYFGVPENERILGMWDLTEDRLFKIRNSLDINGNPRAALLYEPEKDPLSAAAGTAGSADVPGGLTGSVVSYPYRFSYMISIARSFASSLIQLGSDMESALSRQDAEELLYLSSTQEATLLKMGIAVHENQLSEAERDIDVLNISRMQAVERRDYYDNNIREFLSGREKAALAMGDAAAGFSALSGVTSMAAGSAHLMPQVGSPFAMKYGGVEIGSSLSGIAAGYKTMAGIYGHMSQRFQTMAQYHRRKQEWELQRGQTDREIEQIDKQMESAKLRQKSAQMNLEIQKRNYEFQQQSLVFLKSKFSSRELYQWLSGRITSTMWQTYQLALELGLGAQTAYQFETDSAQTFLKFDHWDSGHKGLWAGQSLMLSLNQMEEAYHKQNTRKLEIEKHISMARMLPEALERLKETGACVFQLCEAMFAGDYPGGYLRKISSLSLSIPTILPPYETIKAVLRQNSSLILTQADKAGMDYLMNKQKEAPESIRVSTRYGEKIAISKGIQDTGLFVMDFKDERYLPFEGTGVHSNWSLEMPKESNHFDIKDITDIIITIKYTSKEDEARGSGSFYQYVVSGLSE